MSTATLTAGNVRPISAIKADMANVLSNRPETMLADAKSALMWLPRQAKKAGLATLRLLRVPQIWAFARNNTSKFIGIVGKGPFAVEVLTSNWGQATARAGVKTTAKIVRFAVAVSWKVVTSPLRLFGPTRAVVTKIEGVATTASAKLTPDSGKTFGWLQIASDVVGYHVSPNRTYMKLARTTALAMMSVRVTRQFIPAGWLRTLTYVIDGIVIARAYLEVLDKTPAGRVIARQAKLIETDVRRQAETVDAEATRLTREAAADAANRMRARADKIEADALAAAETQGEEAIARGGNEAAELRQEADALEATAAKISTEAAVAVADRPKPGPTVPSMGGRSPGAGPVQSHPRQSGQGSRSRSR